MGAKKVLRGGGNAPLIVTDRDLQMLRFLSLVPVATARDVCNACFSPGCLTAVRARLTALAGGADYQPRSLVFRFPLPSAGGNPVRVFVFTNTGRDFLRSVAGGRGGKSSYRPSKERVISVHFLRHELAVTACVAAARLYTRRQQAIALSDCRLSDELGRLKPSLPVLPDVWQRWERRGDGRRLGLWIEVDCATQRQSVWVKRFQARLQYLRSGGYREMFGVPGVLLSYVVVGRTEAQGEARRQSLCKWSVAALKERGLEKWAGIVRITSVVLDEIYAHGLFERAVWYTPGAASSDALWGMSRRETGGERP